MIAAVTMIALIALIMAVLVWCERKKGKERLREMQRWVAEQLAKEEH